MTDGLIVAVPVDEVMPCEPVDVPGDGQNGLPDEDTDERKTAVRTCKTCKSNTHSWGVTAS